MNNIVPVTKNSSDKRIIERSIATPELLTHVFMGKYQRHTPFYCQEESYNWQGINLSRQNMCSWQQKVYKALMPLENQFKQELKKGKFLQMDETPLVHLYNFKWTRSGKNVLEFLDGFEGCVLQSDGYSGYDSAVDFWNENHPEHKLTHSNCNIHARRYFADAVKAIGSKTAKEDYLRCLFEKAPYAQNAEDWNNLLPWNIEITPFKMRGEWVE